MLSLIEKIVSLISEKLSGINLIISIIAIISIAIYWWFSGTKGEERQKLIKRIIPVIMIISIAAIVIFTRELFFISSLETPKEKTEIISDSGSQLLDDKKLEIEIKPKPIERNKQVGGEH